MSQTSLAVVWRPIPSINGQRVWKVLLCCKQSVTMSSSDGSSGSGSSGSSDAEDEQHVPQVVTGANADPQVLQYFWDLASLQQDERQTAAEALVAALIDSQKQYDATHRAKGSLPAGSFDQEAGNRHQRMEQCLSCCSPLTAYGLKRLARGLASSRQGARQGFAAALAATLAYSAAAASSDAGQQKVLQQPFVSAAGVLALLDACLEVTGSMKGTDQRDTLLGRVFGLAALTRSGLISAVPSAADGKVNSSPGAVASATAAVAEQLAGLLQRKSFLRESSAAGLVELLQGLTEQQLASVLQQAPKTLSLLQAAPTAASPESLYLCLRLWHAMPAQTLQQCQLLPKLQAGQAPPQVFWERPSTVKRQAVVAAAGAIFSAEQVQRMTPALLLSTASSPRLHPVWGCLLALLVPGFVPVKSQEDQQQKQKQQRRSPPDPQQLEAFWRHFVEGACLSSSHERKALALQLLLLLVPVMGPDMVPVLLSKQLLGCVATATKDKDSYLHATAKRCLDRLSTAADHSQVVQDDPAAAARLRLALAAALQSAKLAAPSSKATKSRPLQGLDAAGVADYVSQTLQDLVQASQGAQGKAEANGAAGSEEESDEEDAAADDGKVLQHLEQLVSGLKLPAADTPTLRKGLSFVAALAWLTLPPDFDAAAAAAGKKAGKKKQKQENGAADAGAGTDTVLQQQEVQEGLQLAASIQPQPSTVLKRTAAARLVGLLHQLHNRAAAAAHQKQTKQQQEGKQQKGSQGSGQQDAAAAAAAAARAAAAQLSETLTTELLSLFAAAQKLPSVSVTADEDIAEMVEQLGQLSDAVEQHVPSVPAAGSNVSQQQQTAAARKRVVLQLVQQLQLQLLSGGLSAEAAGSVVDDLEVSVLRGLGLNGQLLEQLRAADAQAKLKLAGAAAEASSSEEDASSEGGSEEGSDADSDDDDDGSAWQDVLLDLLLSLLSNSSGEGGSSKGGSVSVPSVPLREACEAVFKAFAEDMTAQGISDLLRVLSQRASEVLKSAEEDEDDDMEVEQSEGGDDDSPTSEDDASDLDEEQLKDLHKKTAASSNSESDSETESQDASKQPTANGSVSPAAKSPDAGSDSDSDEGLDDEAMLRMDAQLGAAVRASLSRSGGSAKDRAAALLALQLRVAALLEDWLKKCSRSPLVLSVVLPLLKALVSARGAGGNPTLADRLAGLVTKHLARARPVFPADADAAGAAVTALEADARKVLYYASRDKDPRVAGAAAQSLLVLITAGSEAGGAAAGVAQANAAAALQDFLQHKKSRLQQNWCQQLLSRCFDAVVGGEAAGLQALLTACSKGRNEAIRAKSVQLLPSLITAKQPQQVAAMLAALKQHQALLASALGAGVVGPCKNKDQHATTVKAVLTLLAGVVKQGGGKRLAELVGSETVRELGKSVVVVKAAGVPPKVEVQLDRLVQTAGLEQLVAAGKPDPARLALLSKARAALEGGGGKAAGAAAGNGAPAAANGAAGKGAGKQGKQQDKQQQQDKHKRKADAAAVADEQPEGAKHKKHKKHKEGQQGDAGEQQQQQKRHKKKEKHSAAAAGDEGVAAVAKAGGAAEAAAAGRKGSSKRKHAEAGDAAGEGSAKTKKDKHYKHKHAEK